MPMEQVTRKDRLDKPTFNARLREWLCKTDDTKIGSEEVQGREVWVYVRDAGRLFGLHADTQRGGVKAYLQLVSLYGDEIAWTVVPSRRRQFTAVAYGPEKRRLRYFYLYQKPGRA